MNKLLPAVLVLLVLFSCQRREVETYQFHSPFMQGDITWVESLLTNMTVEQKVGQLIFLNTKIDSTAQEDSLFKWVHREQIGGLMMKGMEVENFIRIVDTIQQVSKRPLFIAADQESVLQNFFSDTYQFPNKASLAAIRSDSLKNVLQAYLINQYRAMGINFTFSPSVNEFCYKRNEKMKGAVFNDKVRLLQNAVEYMDALQKEKIFCAATTFDQFIYVDNDTTNLQESLLFPSKLLTLSGLSGFLIDDRILQIDTLAKLQTHFLKQYLNQHVEFHGMLMGRLTPEITIDKLLHTGADVFIVENDVDGVSKYLTRFIKEGLMSEKVLNEKVAKVLLAKRWIGIDKKPKKLERAFAAESVLDRKYRYLRHKLFKQTLTLVNNNDDLLPFSYTHARKFQLLHVGNKELDEFQSYFSKYALYSKQLIRPDSNGVIAPLKVSKYKNATVIITLDEQKLDSETNLDWIHSVNDLSRKTKTVVVNFGDARNFAHFDTTVTMVQLYETNKLNESFAAQLLFGSIAASGSLPYAIDHRFVNGHNIVTPIIRMEFAQPEEVGIAPEKLVGINAIAKSAIAKGAMPGCQVAVVKDGKMIYSEAFGHHTYRNNQLVKKTDLYDIASITKVAATTLAAMKLNGENKFSINDKLIKHVDCGTDSKLKNITFKKLMAHNSGLQPHMPITEYVFKEYATDTECNYFFCKQKQGDYSLQIADSMFIDKNFVDTIWRDVYDIKLKRKRKKFQYSDVNLNLVFKMVENVSKKPIDEYVKTHFYNPLGLRRLMYNPLKRYRPKDIVPTQDDATWRKQLLRGYVHDEGAALMGGVAGNAGLFSNAEDLAVLFQMMLNGGEYGGKRYLKSESIDLFTSKKWGNHRGLGFDIKRSGNKSASSKASNSTYGHTGFTGACVWVDPKEDLIFIFLSNRIHPDMDNTKLYKEKVRKRMHTVIYDALGTYTDPDWASTVKTNSKLAVK